VHVYAEKASGENLDSSGMRDLRKSTFAPQKKVVLPNPLPTSLSRRFLAGPIQRVNRICPLESCVGLCRQASLSPAPSRGLVGPIGCGPYTAHDRVRRRPGLMQKGEKPDQLNNAPVLPRRTAATEVLSYAGDAHTAALRGGIEQGTALHEVPEQLSAARPVGPVQ
jgi:hypothetical protein